MIIGICDDDRGDRACIREICEAAAQENKSICTFIEFESARDYWESEHKVDLLILETKMPEMTGIELKNKMQELHDRTMIIFVSNHVEMMPLAFGIHVYGFVDTNKSHRIKYAFQLIQTATQQYAFSFSQIDPAIIIL